MKLKVGDKVQVSHVGTGIPIDAVLTIEKYNQKHDFWDTKEQYYVRETWLEEELIKIIGNNEPVITNEKGGMQSDIGVAYHLVPPKAIGVVARVFAEGAKKYAPNNWKLISTDEHVNHAVNHMYKHLAHDPTEEHLAHAACRALMALEMYLETKNG